MVLCLISLFSYTRRWSCDTTKFAAASGQELVLPELMLLRRVSCSFDGEELESKVNVKRSILKRLLFDDHQEFWRYQLIALDENR